MSKGTTDEKANEISAAAPQSLTVEPRGQAGGKRGLVFGFDAEGKIRIVEQNLSTADCLALLNVAAQYARVRGEQLLLTLSATPALPLPSKNV